MADNAKRVFWFDDHKTPNVADVLSEESDITLHRLAFDGLADDNWAVMEQSHVYCITSAKDEVPDLYKGTKALLERFRRSPHLSCPLQASHRRRGRSRPPR